MPNIRTRSDKIAEQSQSGKRRLASLQVAAEYAGVHVNTLRRRIAHGDLPGYRLGARLIRVDLDDVDRMLSPIPTVGMGK